MEKNTNKIFALVDCNSFFVSCERAFRPDLENKPVVVLSNNDGCVVSRSKEAKDLFIPMGAPYFQYREYMKKNGVEAFSSNFPLYGDLSHRVMDTLHTFTDHMEIYSIDEAFLYLENSPSLFDFVKEIKHTVKQWTRIPVSIGIGPTKVLAKVANFIAKKHSQYQGIFQITPENADDFLQDISVESIWGIGRKLAPFLRENKITTALELKNSSDAWIKKNLKLNGVRLVSELRGISCLPIDEINPPKKGIMSTRSFGKAITSYQDLKEAIITYTSRAAEKLRQEKEQAGYISIFIRTNNFNKDPKYSGSRGMPLPVATSYTPALIKAAIQLLDEVYQEGFRYSKAGVGLMNLTPEGEWQQNFFQTDEHREKRKKIMASVDAMNRKFGKDTLQYLGSGLKKNWKMKSDFHSPCFTTRIGEIPCVR